MNKSISSWNEAFDGVPSEHTIRNRYDSNKYRVSKYAYPKGTMFPGTMKSGTCFVIEGECRHSFNDFTVSLKEGEYADLPNGSYEFQVLGDADAVIVLVWKLPELSIGASNTTT